MNKKQARFLVLIAGIIVFIRWLFTGIMGLMPQDAYYYLYARHLALSYYDHPPAIAYLLRLFTELFGRKVFVIKLADTITTTATLIAFYFLALQFLSRKKAGYALLLLVSTLMISILSLISTPDVPMMLCWTLSLLCLRQALFKGKKIFWIWAGIMTGLTFDSKYTAVLLIAGLFIFLVLSKKHRHWLWTVWPALFLILFCLTILPVFIWNKQNHFASFRFQSSSRLKSMEGFHISLSDFAGVIGHQSAVLMPILFFSLLYFIWKTVRKYGKQFLSIPDDQLFLLCFFIPAFAGFLGLSFFYWVKLNWMMPAYISGIIWVSRFWKSKWLFRQLMVSLIIHLALAAELLFNIIPIQSDDTWLGWQELSEKVTEVKSQHPGAFVFSSDDYKTSAELNFYLQDMVYSKNVVGEHALQFDFIGTDLNLLQGRDAIFIDSNPRFDHLENENRVPHFFFSYFDRIQPLQPILIEKNGNVIRKFSVFLCSNYHRKH